MCTSIVYASGEEEEIDMILDEEEPSELATEMIEGIPFSEEGNVIVRDLLYDAETNKQFVTIQTRNGSVFYLVIDYDKPLDEKEEQYQTYFLNLVDERDLEDLLKEETESTPIVCSCTEKCELGAVSVECPLCSQDIKSCVGKEPTPTEATTVEPVVTEQQVKGETKKSSSMYVVIILLLLLVGGGVFAYLKFGKETKKAKVPSSLDDYDFEEEDDEMEVYEDDGDEGDTVAEDEDE